MLALNTGDFGGDVLSPGGRFRTGRTNFDPLGTTGTPQTNTFIDNAAPPPVTAAGPFNPSPQPVTPPPMPNIPTTQVTLASPQSQDMGMLTPQTTIGAAPMGPAGDVNAESVRPTSFGKFNPQYAQNLASFAGGGFMRPGGQLNLDILGNQPFQGIGQPIGGGNAPLGGLGRGLLEEALGKSPLLNPAMGFDPNRPTVPQF